MIHPKKFPLSEFVGRDATKEEAKVIADLALLFSPAKDKATVWGPATQYQLARRKKK